MGAYLVANSDNEIVAVASKYKNEFDSQKVNWLCSNLAGTSAEHALTDNCSDSEKRNNSDSISTASSLRTKSSSRSSVISIKQVDAEIEYETALLKTEQLNERIEEQNLKLTLQNEEQNLKLKLQSEAQNLKMQEQSLQAQSNSAKHREK